VRIPPLVATSLLLAVGPALGCSSSSDGSHESVSDAGEDSAVVDAAASCPDLLPPTCPSPEPSYEDDVLPIIEQHCYMCHADAGIVTSGSGVDFGSYAALYAIRGDVLSQLNACRMPPATALQPTAGQRTTVLGWLKCNAPDN